MRAKRLVSLVFLVTSGLAPTPPAVAHDMVAATARAMPSVVSVLPDWPASGPPRADEPEGSGVAVAPGLIATADHVIGPAKSVRVRLADGRIVTAEIVLRDRATDIAFLRISEILQPVEMTGDPQPGAPVCAIGNAFGLGLSVTCGVVSATHRAGVGFNAIEDFVQTDTVVNPGASGGALVDGEGRLVGMLSAIFTKGTDADIGVNFAVSAALLQAIVTQAESGTVQHVSLGVALTPEPPRGRAGQVGLRVTRVEPGSLAEGVGLAAGDLIVSADGVATGTVEGLRGMLERTRGAATLHVVRKGKARDLKLRPR